jgi:CelD/BcsL family acetyltransferase involved in cellulose biosynthesis
MFLMQEVRDLRGRRGGLGSRHVVADGLNVSVYDTRAGLDALAPEYDRLGRMTANALPFAQHDWHVAWWNHFAKSTSSVRDELMVHVVRDERGACVAIVPLVLSRRGLGNLSVGIVSFIGPDANITEMRGPLVAPGFEGRAAWAVHRHLAEDRRWDWIDWSGISGPFGEALAVAGSLEWKAPIPDYVLDLAPTWDAFRSSLKRNIRESLRHCYNSLKRDGVAWEPVIAESPGDVRRGIDEFLVLHSARAQANAAVEHADRFEGDAARGFLYEVCDRLARRGMTRVILLKVGSHVVAARIAFVISGSLYLYYSGFDPAWGKYSVMTTTVAEAIKYAIDRGLATVNLSPGTDVSKTRWGPRLVHVDQAIERRSGLVPRLAYASYLRIVHGTTPPWAAAVLGALPRRT